MRNYFLNKFFKGFYIKIYEILECVFVFFPQLLVG